MQSQGIKKLKIPDNPGVYFFIAGKEILYIGKATSLKDRVKSYFGKDIMDTRGPLILDMVFKATDIKWQETDSVLEALILEANLIKKHQPIYNTKEKSDKSFNYVCITKGKKIALVRGRMLQKHSYASIFGPFPSGSQLREALKIIRKIFPFIEERRGTKGRDEFYKQIELYPADSVENKNNIRNIKLFFEGKKGMILKNLVKEMKAYAKVQAFEKAGEMKRQIFALQHIHDVALIKDEGAGERTGFRIEAYDVAHMGGKNMVGVMVVVEGGQVNKNEYRKFKIRGFDTANDTGALREMLERRLKHTEWRYPDLIVVDGGIAQKNTAEKILKENKLKIHVSAVVKDDRHKAKMILQADPKLKKSILLANSEAHRFAIKYHKEKREKSFLA